MFDYVLNAGSTKTSYFQLSGNGVRYTGLNKKCRTVCLKYDKVCMKYNRVCMKYNRVCMKYNRVCMKYKRVCMK